MSLCTFKCWGMQIRTCVCPLRAGQSTLLPFVTTMLLRGGFLPSPRTCRGEERIFSLSSQWQDLSKTDFFVLA